MFKKLIFSLSLAIPLFAGGLITKCSGQTPPTKFGILVNGPKTVELSLQDKLRIAKEVGVKYYRTKAILENFNGTIPQYDDITSAGFKVIININYGMTGVGEDRQAVPFPTNMNDYKAKLSSMLDRYKPELVVVENEETNIAYHAGTAADYARELKTAVEVAHSKGLKVTNGGLMPVPLKILVWQNYKAQGKNAEADDFASRTLPQEIINDLPNLSKSPGKRKQVEMTKELLSYYKNIDMDYINFHWYEPNGTNGVRNRALKAAAVRNVQNIDTRALGEVIQYLESTTGKVAMTNEVGQLDQSPATVSAMLNKLAEFNMPYVVWFSGDDGEGKATALHNNDGSLRQTGQTLCNYIKTKPQQ